MVWRWCGHGVDMGWRWCGCSSQTSSVQKMSTGPSIWAMQARRVGCSRVCDVSRFPSHVNHLCTCVKAMLLLIFIHVFLICKNTVLFSLTRCRSSGWTLRCGRWRWWCLAATWALISSSISSRTQPHRRDDRTSSRLFRSCLGLFVIEV